MVPASKRDSEMKETNEINQLTGAAGDWLIGFVDWMERWGSAPKRAMELFEWSENNGIAFVALAPLNCLVVD